MMPVIRISEETYAHLQRWAKPFEDTTPESVIIKALAALDMMDGDVPLPPKVPTPKRTDAPKVPQKEFRLPLLMTLMKFGGKASAREVRGLLGAIMSPLLRDGDFESVSTGDPRWWNAACWERSDLVKEGLMRSDSDRGIWEVSDVGQSLNAQLIEKVYYRNETDQIAIATGSLQEIAEKYWHHRVGARPSVKVDDALFDPILLRHVDELELSVRTSSCLRNERIHWIGDLVQRTQEDMLRGANFGRKSLTELQEELAQYGLRLGMPLPGGPIKFID